jgi:hypothetical protein
MFGILVMAVPLDLFDPKDIHPIQFIPQTEGQKLVALRPNPLLWS